MGDKKVKIISTVTKRNLPGNWADPNFAIRAYAIYIENQWNEDLSSFCGVEIEIRVTVGDAFKVEGYDTSISCWNNEVALSVMEALTPSKQLIEGFMDTDIAKAQVAVPAAPRMVSRVTNLND